MKRRTEKNNRNCIHTSNRQGFTLIEMLIAMLIFSMTATMVLGAYFDVFQSKRRTRAVQQDIEDARYAMELMAKTIRMSSVFVDDEDANSIEIYDYSQGKCLKYLLVDGVLMVQEGVENELPGKDDDGKTWVESCGSFGGGKPMTTAKVDTLNFNIKKSRFGSDDERELGYVTMALKVCYEDNCDFDSATIQTGVSLRDYSYINDGE